MKILKIGVGKHTKSMVQKRPHGSTIFRADRYPAWILSSFPAPWFWAIKELTAEAKPSEVIQEIDSICAPTFCTATAASPYPATSLAMVMEMPVNTRLCRQEGSPSRKISEAFLESGACSKWIWWNRIWSWLAKNKKSSVTTICAMIVAMAAPVTFNAGNGPIPKIRSGSRMMLITSPTLVERKAGWLFPIAVNSPVNIWFKNENITSPHVIIR